MAILCSGYMAPEYAITGHYSVKSDIYSFGVIVLEIVSGERNGFLQGSHLEEALLYRVSSPFVSTHLITNYVLLH